MDIELRNDRIPRNPFDRQFLDMRIQAGDTLLQDHLLKSAGNALYTSKTIQNELIGIFGDLLVNEILKRVRTSSFFSITADEATDAANDEQLSICIRFVDGTVPCERFLAFVSGKAIADSILAKLEIWQLQPQFLRGQAYDGAEAMAGASKGAAARITARYPKALYTHCASHRLNLCVVKCCKIQEVNSMMQTADNVCRFFSNSPKRQLALEKCISQICSEEKRKCLKEMCRTRWVERHEALEVFSDLFLPIVSCLEEIMNNAKSDWNRETRSDANSYLLALSQFSFVVALHVTERVLSYVKGLSVKLQGKSIDVVHAYRDISMVKAALKKARCGSEKFHEIVYSDAVALVHSVGIEESYPRIASYQLHRSNTPAANASQYYQRTLTMPMLDHLITELDNRFEEGTAGIIGEFLQILPSELVSSSVQLKPSHFKDVLQLDKDDLPSAKALHTELDLWRMKWKNESIKAKELDTPTKTLTFVDKDYIPNIYDSASN